LESFYYELQDPTLIDVDIEYQTNAVEFTSLTRTSFPQYFQGSEIIIAGKLNEHAPLQWTAKVKGRGSKNSLDTETSPTPFQVRADSDTTIMEKVWAYMKINDLLKNTAITDDVETKAILKKRTLALSLKYNFVTPLTSMVVSESLQTPRFSVDDIQTMSARGRGRNHLTSLTSGSVPLQMQPAYKKVNVQPRHDHSLIKSKGTAQNSNTANINRTELMTTFMWIAFTIMMII